MKPAFLNAGLIALVFSFGFVLGYGFRGSNQDDSIAGDVESPVVGIDGGDAAPRGTRVPWPGQEKERFAGRSRRPDAPEEHDFDEGHRERPRSATEALKDLQAALARGNRDAVHDALHQLGRPEAGALSSEEVEELAALLEAADRDLIHNLSRALVVSGGKEGLARVMGFVDDPNQPLDLRRQALEGLSELPEEKVAGVFPVLADFLESSPPHELEHAAAHAMARMQREEGVNALLGLLDERPGIRPGALFDAIGDVGKPGDLEMLFAFLDRGGNQREKTSILRAASRISVREGDTETLLAMLHEAPEGTSRSMIARAISESAHELGTGFLSEALKEVAGDRRAQECLARALSHTGGREALEALMQADSELEGGLDLGVLARALNEFRGKDALPVMMDLFQAGGDEEMLHSLARGMVRNADAETLGDLLTLLGDGGSQQRRAIAEALEEGDSSALSQDLLLSMLRSERDHQVAKSLARSLSQLHPEAIGEEAGAWFDTAESPAERVALAEVLREQLSPGAQDRIARQLRVETDEQAYWELSRILGSFGDSGVSQVAEVLRGERDVKKRHRMLWGLEAAGRHERAPVRELFLQVASTDPAPSVRAQAAEILQRQQDPSLIPALQALLAREAHPEVQERIRAALRDLQE